MVGQGRLLVKNILQSFEKEKSYFISANKFRLKGVKVGPLPKGKKIKLKICNFINNNFKIRENELLEYVHSDESYNGSTDYELYFTPELTIHSDIKITFQGVVNFYIWVNLWYSSWENIKKFYDKSELNNLEDEENKNNNNSEEKNSKPGKIIKDSNNVLKPKDTFKVYDDENKESNKNITNDKDISIEEKREDNSDNRMLDIFSDKEKINSSKSLYEIIYRLKHNTDLNELINRINIDLEDQFDKKSMEIVLNSYEFDKFKEIKKYPNIRVTIYYSLLDKQY